MHYNNSILIVDITVLYRAQANVHLPTLSRSLNCTTHITPNCCSQNSLLKVRQVWISMPIVPYWLFKLTQTQSEGKWNRHKCASRQLLVEVLQLHKHKARSFLKSITLVVKVVYFILCLWFLYCSFFLDKRSQLHTVVHIFQITCKHTQKNTN